MTRSSLTSHYLEPTIDKATNRVQTYSPANILSCRVNTICAANSAATQSANGKLAVQKKLKDLPHLITPESRVLSSVLQHKNYYTYGKNYVRD